MFQSSFLSYNTPTDPLRLSCLDILTLRCMEIGGMYIPDSLIEQDMVIVLLLSHIIALPSYFTPFGITIIINLLRVCATFFKQDPKPEILVRLVGSSLLRFYYYAERDVRYCLSHCCSVVQVVYGDFYVLGISKI